MLRLAAVRKHEKSNLAPRMQSDSLAGRRKESRMQITVTAGLISLPLKTEATTSFWGNENKPAINNSNFVEDLFFKANVKKNTVHLVL